MHLTLIDVEIFNVLQRWSSFLHITSKFCCFLLINCEGIWLIQLHFSPAMRSKINMTINTEIFASSPTPRPLVNFFGVFCNAGANYHMRVCEKDISSINNARIALPNTNLRAGGLNEKAAYGKYI